uniref:Uncharacterized protein n=1 Tax=Ditylenchus dipsaci TaxID=166011 RepID=A0A915D7X5_9BILA
MHSRSGFLKDNEGIERCSYKEDAVVCEELTDESDDESEDEEELEELEELFEVEEIEQEVDELEEQWDDVFIEEEIIEQQAHFTCKDHSLQNALKEVFEQKDRSHMLQLLSFLNLLIWHSKWNLQHVGLTRVKLE